MKYKLVRNIFKKGLKYIEITYDDIDELLGKSIFDEIREDARATFGLNTPVQFRRNDYCRITFFNDSCDFDIQTKFDYIVEADSGEEYEYYANLYIKLNSELEYVSFEVVTQN